MSRYNLPSTYQVYGSGLVCCWSVQFYEGEKKKKTVVFMQRICFIKNKLFIIEPFILFMYSERTEQGLKSWSHLCLNYYYERERASIRKKLEHNRSSPSGLGLQQHNSGIYKKTKHKWNPSRIHTLLLKRESKLCDWVRQSSKKFSSGRPMTPWLVLLFIIPRYKMFTNKYAIYPQCNKTLHFYQILRHSNLHLHFFFFLSVWFLVSQCERRLLQDAQGTVDEVGLVKDRSRHRSFIFVSDFQKSTSHWGRASSASSPPPHPRPPVPLRLTHSVFLCSYISFITVTSGWFGLEKP